MPFPISCPNCEAQFSIPDSIYERRVAGQVTKIRCKKCGRGVLVDGTQAIPTTAIASLPPETSAAPAPSSKPSTWIGSTAPPSSIPPPFPKASARLPSVPPPPERKTGSALATPLIFPGPKSDAQSSESPANHSEETRETSGHSAQTLGRSDIGKQPTKQSVSAAEPAETQDTPEQEIDLPTNPIAAEAAPAPELDSSGEEVSGSSQPTTGEQDTELFRLRQGALVPSQPPSAVRKHPLLQMGLVFAAVAAVAIVFAISRSMRPEPSPTGTEQSAEAPGTEPARTEPVSIPAPPAETTVGAEAAPEAREPKAEPAPAPDTHEKRSDERVVPGLDESMQSAMTRALNCHRGGRANGTADIVFTLTPQGRAKDVRLEGEPIASAPVGRCVSAQIKALVVPPFDGPAMTVRRTITLRD